MEVRAWLGQAVMNPESILPADDQAGVPQICQMTRDRRLGQVQSVMQVTNADFPPLG